MSQYLLADSQGNIPQSAIICSDPVVQSYNRPLHRIQIPFIVCQDPVYPSLQEPCISLAELHEWHLDPGSMTCPIIFDVAHPWRIFGSSLDSLYGLWMFNLLGHLPLELSERKEGGLGFRSKWIKEVKGNLEDAISGVTQISMQASFIPGSPLPRLFDLDLLKTSFQAPDEACKVRALAIIVMGELLAFLNQWRVTLGKHWIDGLSPAVKACPTFLLNMESSTDSQRLLRISNELNEIYHSACVTAGSSNLAEEEIPELRLFTKEFRTSNAHLQTVAPTRLNSIPLFIPSRALVFLHVEGWAPIPLPRALWLLARWTYKSEVAPYQGDGGRTIVQFCYERVLEWVGDSSPVQEARSRQENAKKSGIWDELVSLAERYAPTHSPTRHSVIIDLNLKFPYIHSAYPVIDLTTSEDSSEEGDAYIPTSPTNTLQDVEETGPPAVTEELVYPFSEVELERHLPIPGPIANSTVLPGSDLPLDEVNHRYLVTDDPEELVQSPTISKIPGDCHNEWLYVRLAKKMRMILPVHLCLLLFPGARDTIGVWETLPQKSSKMWLMTSTAHTLKLITFLLATREDTARKILVCPTEAVDAYLTISYMM
ncbi:hypothetical protein EDD18DRAFT_1107385 [Armillaria luteobubalina]|uniref:Uncharacterized protein n=1 Tax=Armillaria luteobubalina TaxID=153913 RepID=A0AA39Q1E3_9AGAR|nr:hypothetical protein EDD18DRAFT_1107385 [Armillaria luteobubalina]